MLTVRLLIVGRTKSPFLREGESFYAERIKRYAKFEWIEIRPANPELSPEEFLASEGDAIIKRLPPRHYLISLERDGRAYDSVGFAQRIARLSQDFSSFCFIIGGALGLAKKVGAACQERLSLSRMTLTHEMARLVLLEQLYTILKGEKYHK